MLPRCYQLNDHAQLYTHVLEAGAVRCTYYEPAYYGYSYYGYTIRVIPPTLTRTLTRGAPPPLAWPTFANFNQLMKVAPPTAPLAQPALHTHTLLTHARTHTRTHALTRALTRAHTLTRTHARAHARTHTRAAHTRAAHAHTRAGVTRRLRRVVERDAPRPAHAAAAAHRRD